MAKRNTDKENVRVDRKGAMGPLIMLNYDKDAKRVNPAKVDRAGAMGPLIMLNYDKGSKKSK